MGAFLYIWYLLMIAGFREGYTCDFATTAAQQVDRSQNLTD